MVDWAGGGRARRTGPQRLKPILRDLRHDCPSHLRIKSRALAEGGCLRAAADNVEERCGLRGRVRHGGRKMRVLDPLGVTGVAGYGVGLRVATLLRVTGGDIVAGYQRGLQGFVLSVDIGVG